LVLLFLIAVVIAMFIVGFEPMNPSGSELDTVSGDRPLEVAGHDHRERWHRGLSSVLTPGSEQRNPGLG
jgi:hypothetical protein